MTAGEALRTPQEERDVWRHTDLDALLARFRGLSLPTEAGAARSTADEKIDLTPHAPVAERTIVAARDETASSGTVIVAPATQADLALRFVGGGIEKPFFTFALAEDADLACSLTLDGVGVQVGTYVFTVASRARLRLFVGARRRTLARAEIFIRLTGTNSRADVTGLLIGADASHVDLVVTVTHEAERTVSRQTVRSVLDDTAKGVFIGKVRVRPTAQKTDAQQSSRALLLSKSAHMVAQPELEIDADDVVCGHGSAVGALDDEALFYLRSRGLAEAEARALLTRAFLAEAADAIDHDALRARAETFLQESLPHD
jgi:Fe-S cluster assembly scaffold protein SufB